MTHSNYDILYIDEHNDGTADVKLQILEGQFEDIDYQEEGIRNEYVRKNLIAEIYVYYEPSPDFTGLLDFLNELIKEYTVLPCVN